MHPQPSSHPLQRPPAPRRRALSAAALTLGVTAALTPTTATAALIPPAGPWPTSITGATNPLIGTPFTFNGSHATANAQLSIWLPSRGRKATQLTRSVSSQTLIRGRLRNRDSRRSIAGATLTLAQQNVYAPEWTALVNIRTNRKGYFRATLPPGYHRRIGAFYYPTLTSRVPVFSRHVLLRAKSRVNLARPFGKRRSYRFDGQVTGGILTPPASGLLIALQVRNRNGNWITARLLRTTASGRYRIRYRFPSRGVLRVRIYVPSQTDWPLFAGTSTVRVIHPR